MEVNQRQKVELLETLRGVVHFIQDPGQVSSVFEIQRGLSNQPISLKNVEFMLSNPAIKALADEKYQPARPSLTDLVGLPGITGLCLCKVTS